ncbi:MULTISPECIES: PHP domain-containing protein [Nocardioides]|uniref:Histidinol-phosphatase n=1 Tax=Nocardioides vastitatis TaxID=2568655 RepID=A0ABW0ZGN7_9ACTN|nr:PHP domain-containing protein [Nocardioides sp.]THJ09206.1 PHP domain-containing protein [Nocardioides sp.]
MDSHTHSEWSWDTTDGSMERSCARAVEIGLPAIAFTEHLDHTVLTVDREELDAGHPMVLLSDPDGRLSPPAFDVAGYLSSIERCREQFPGLQILSGLEVGEPHWHPDAVRRVLAAGQFDRVLGSLHCLPEGERFHEPPGMYGRVEQHEVMRRYLEEIAVLVRQSDAFSVLAHIDYPVRAWPGTDGPFDPLAFEEEFRHALRATADSGKALEINTMVPLHDTILRWWREEGGVTVTFGSDAHNPSRVARNLREAAAMAEAHGFRPGRDPLDFWARPR